MEGSVFLTGASVCNGEYIEQLLENGGFLHTLSPISFTWWPQGMNPRVKAKGRSDHFPREFRLEISAAHQ